MAMMSFAFLRASCRLTSGSLLRPTVRRPIELHSWRFNSFQSVKLPNIGHSTLSKLATLKTAFRSVSKIGQKVCLSSLLSVSTFTALGLSKLHHSQFVLCEGNSRLQGSVSQETDTQFPWNEFFKLLVPDIWYLIGAVLSALAVAFINVEIPLLLGGLVNVLAKHSVPGATDVDFLVDIKQPAVKLVLMYCSQGLLTAVYISLLSTLAEKMAARMRQRLFESLIVQDIAFFDANKTGEIVNRLTTDVQDFKSSMKLCISQGLRSVTQTLGCMVSMFVVSPKLTGLMLLVVSGIIGIGSLMGSGLRKLSRQAQAQIAKSTGVADEALGNVRTVRAFAMEPTEIRLFNREVEKSSRLNQLLGVGIGIFQGLSNIALNGLVLGTLYVGGFLMSQKEVNAGDLMSFMVATQTIQRSLAQVSMLFGQAVRGLTAGSRVFEYMSLQPGLPVSGGKIIPYHSLMGNVEFKHINFAYPTRADHQVLTDFNLSIQGGRMVALVGLSGNGKSTVAALLERFYDVNSGSITLDGQDIKTLDPSWLRGRVIGFINQEPVLFATTVLENIRYGRPDATDTEVKEAAKLAHADDFITQFPNGYQTVLGERGVTVSGGQKQRIAIARALLKNPRVLILDEATSALDSESERIVQDALDHVVQGRTVLVIAHRLSTVRNADVIAVVSNGRIVEMGSHDELRRKKGYYWQLIRNQEQHKETFASRIFNGA